MVSIGGNGLPVHTRTHTHLLVVLVDIAVSELFPAQLALVRFVLAVDDFMSRHLV